MVLSGSLRQYLRNDVRIMLNLFDVIRIEKPIPHKNLSIGDRGTILLIYEESNLPLAYEIEFVNENGQSISVTTLTDEEVREYCKIIYRK